MTTPSSYTSLDVYELLTKAYTAAYPVDIEAFLTQLTAFIAPTYVNGFYPDNVTGYVARDFSADTSEIFNQAIISAIALNVPLIVPPGNYRLDKSIFVRSNLRMICSPLARFEARFTTTGTNGMVTLENRDNAANSVLRERDIYIEGGSWGKAAGFTGNVFSIWADKLVFNRTMVDGFGNGRAYYLLGDDIRMFFPTFWNPFSGGGAGGIRFAGGNRFVCIGAVGTSGDDALQAVPGGSFGSTWANQTINDFSYVSCRVTSTSSRVLVCGLGSESGAPGWMTCSIIQGLFLDCIGVGAGLSVAMDNEDSSGNIDTITMKSCRISDAGNDTRPTAISVTAKGAGTGAVKNILLDDVSVDDNWKGCFRAIGTVSDVTIRNPKFSKARSTGVASIRFLGTTGFRVEGGYAFANGDHVVEVGIVDGSGILNGRPGTAYRGFIGSGFEARDIPDGKYGVQAAYANTLTVDQSRYLPASGSTTARAVHFDVNCTLAFCDSTDSSLLPHATPLFDEGTANWIGPKNIVSAAAKYIEVNVGASTVVASNTITPASGCEVVRITGNSVTGNCHTIAIPVSTNYPRRIWLMVVGTACSITFKARSGSTGNIYMVSDIVCATNEGIQLVWDITTQGWRYCK